LALTTEADPAGDDYVITGHKIWSSHAGISTHGLVLARTDRRASPHRGLSMFVVDNTTPGLDIRPIRSLTGEIYHYEVFLDRVRVPADFRLGAENEGFVQLLLGLDTDRFWGRFYKAAALKRVLGELVEYANATVRHGTPLARDPVVRGQLAALATDVEVLRLLFYRTGWLIAQGLPTPYESALGKVLADETGQRLAAVGMEILGLFGSLKPGSPWAALGGRLQHLYQTTLGHTIAGGTSEILRSTVATRGLGLPREPRARS
jgi:alkylation response protein AidB-like acyl-CoA dehydrogenase